MIPTPDKCENPYIDITFCTTHFRAVYSVVLIIYLGVILLLGTIEPISWLNSLHGTNITTHCFCCCSCFITHIIIMISRRIKLNRQVAQDVIITFGYLRAVAFRLNSDVQYTYDLYTREYLYNIRHDVYICLNTLQVYI